MKELDQNQTEEVSGARIFQCFKKPPVITTLALGEEGPRMTTMVVGEEDPVITTLALGEEGGGGGTFLPTDSALGAF